jgi:hypothetical protein
MTIHWITSWTSWPSLDLLHFIFIQPWHQQMIQIWHMNKSFKSKSKQTNPWGLTLINNTTHGGSVCFHYPTEIRVLKGLGLVSSFPLHSLFLSLPLIVVSCFLYHIL